ncbi:MAG: PadR family transcriptional regulator [Gemmatimonadota bacterium]|nr:PadR family transcriptional regulator [Gemmatimonadota bacterium]
MKRGDLKFVLLRLLTEEPMHGYELIRRLEEESRGMYSPSPGSVYPTLQLLEDRGYVSSEEMDGKRVYHITDEGRAYLDEHLSRARDVLGRVVDLGEKFTGSEMRDVTRSFIHLAQVSFERSVGGDADTSTLRRVKEILDRAAREIEQAWPEAGAEPQEG